MAIQEAGHYIKGFNACKSPSGYVPIVWTRRGQEQGLQRGTRPCEWDLRGKAPLEAHDMSVIRSKPLCGHVPIVWTRRGQEQDLQRGTRPCGWDLRGKAPLEAHDMSVIRSKPLCGYVPIVWTRRGQEQGFQRVKGFCFSSKRNRHFVRQISCRVSRWATR